MNLQEIEELITSVADLKTLEFKLNSKDFKIVVKRNKAYKKIKMIPPVPVVIDKKNTVCKVDSVPKNILDSPLMERTNINLNLEDYSKYDTIKSSFIGTCLLQPLQDKSENISIGDVIKKGDILCSVEALGIHNEIRSDVSGKIIAILSEAFSPVDYDQPLFLIA